jgi:hypothetical protein
MTETAAPPVEAPQAEVPPQVEGGGEQAPVADASLLGIDSNQEVDNTLDKMQESADAGKDDLMEAFLNEGPSGSEKASVSLIPLENVSSDANKIDKIDLKSEFKEMGMSAKDQLRAEARLNGLTSPQRDQELDKMKAELASEKGDVLGKREANASHNSENNNGEHTNTTNENPRDEYKKLQEELRNNQDNVERVTGELVDETKSPEGETIDPDKIIDIDATGNKEQQNQSEGQEQPKKSYAELMQEAQKVAGEIPKTNFKDVIKNNPETDKEKADNKLYSDILAQKIYDAQQIGLKLNETVMEQLAQRSFEEFNVIRAVEAQQGNEQLVSDIHTAIAESQEKINNLPEDQREAIRKAVPQIIEYMSAEGNKKKTIWEIIFDILKSVGMAVVVETLDETGITK